MRKATFEGCIHIRPLTRADNVVVVNIPKYTVEEVNRCVFPRGGDTLAVPSKNKDLKMFFGVMGYEFPTAVFRQASSSGSSQGVRGGVAQPPPYSARIFRGGIRYHGRRVDTIFNLHWGHSRPIPFQEGPLILNTPSAILATSIQQPECTHCPLVAPSQ